MSVAILAQAILAQAILRDFHDHTCLAIHPYSAQLHHLPSYQTSVSHSAHFGLSGHHFVRAGVSRMSFHPAGDCPGALALHAAVNAERLAAGTASAFATPSSGSADGTAETKVKCEFTGPATSLLSNSSISSAEAFALAMVGSTDGTAATRTPRAPSPEPKRRRGDDVDIS